MEDLKLAKKLVKALDMAIKFERAGPGEICPGSHLLV